MTTQPTTKPTPADVRAAMARFDANQADMIRTLRGVRDQQAKLSRHANWAANRRRFGVTGPMTRAELAAGVTR